MEVSLFGIPFSNLTIEELSQTIMDERVDSQSTCLIFTANIDHICNIHANQEFMEAYRAARIRTVDGWPIQIAARFLKGVHVKRVTGADLFASLAARFNPERHRVAFIVPTAEVGKRLEQHMVQSLGFSENTALWYCPPHGFDQNPKEVENLIQVVSSIRPTHVIFGLGAPKSEIFAYNYGQHWGGSYVACFGAGLEFFVKTKTRAPVLLRAAGLEWFWRLIQEPRRLGTRYLKSGWGFVGLLKRL